MPVLRRAGRVVSVTDREHLSIGEVLSLLQAEFPDVTISKIRFLESQGLIDPERTPSGYRKFYDADVARLRWILVQQRDHFLPLKVIKDRLEGGAAELPFDPPLPGDAPPEAGVDGVASPSGPAASGTGADGDPAGRKVAPGDGDDGPGATAAVGVAGSVERSTAGDDAPGARRPDGGRGDGGRGDGGRGQGAGAPLDADRALAAGSVDPEPDAAPRRPGRAPAFNVFTGSPTRREPSDAPPARPAGDDPGDGPGPGAAAGRATGEGDGEEAGGEEPTGRGARGAAAGATRRPTRRPALFERAARERAEAAERLAAEAAERPGGAQDVAAERSRRRREATARRRAEISAVSFTAEELAAAVGLSVAAIAELERYGLLASRSVAQGRRYDEDAVVVAKLAARFANFGIEARHLRMFRVAVERELALYEQVISPLGRARAEGAEARAAEVFDELDRLGADLRDALFHRRDP